MPKRMKYAFTGAKELVLCCGMCDYSTHSMTGLRLHKRKLHDDSVRLTEPKKYCVVCDTEFRDNDDLLKHYNQTGHYRF